VVVLQILHRLGKYKIMKAIPVAVATAVVVAAVVTTLVADPALAFSSSSQPKKIIPGARSTPNDQQQQQHINTRLSSSSSSSRREVFGTAAAIFLGGVSAVIPQQPQPANAAIKTGVSNSFTGDYDDPNHPKCLRQVKVVGGPLNGSGTRSAFPVIEITGYDGKGGSGSAESESKVCTTRPSSLDDLWQVSGSVQSPTTAKVDFSRRGGPDEPILVTYENGAILFPDGNKWKKIPEQKDRRPKDLSTLSDGPKFRERDDDDYDY